MDLVIFLPLLIIMGAFLFFSSRRQKKAMQATIDLHSSLEVGDRINTISGLQGTIAGIGDDYVDLEIAPGVVTKWMKLAVRDRIEDDLDEDLEDDLDDDLDDDLEDDADSDDEFDDAEVAVDLNKTSDPVEPRSTQITDRPNTNG